MTRTVLETADAPTTFILLKKAELIDGELVDYAGSEWHVWAEDAAGEIAYDATATTGEDGSFVLERIPHGDGLAYYCQETKTGDDYILDPEVYEFSVDEEGLIAGEPAYVFLNTNYHKRIIEAHKVDQDTGEPVGKTGFGLYRWIGEGSPTRRSAAVRASMACSRMIPTARWTGACGRWSPRGRPTTWAPSSSRAWSSAGT